MSMLWLSAGCLQLFKRSSHSRLFGVGELKQASAQAGSLKIGLANNVDTVALKDCFEMLLKGTMTMVF